MIIDKLQTATNYSSGIDEGIKILDELIDNDDTVNKKIVSTNNSVEALNEEYTENFSKHIWKSDSFDLTLKNNAFVRERTIKLPETHIFTPNKESIPIAREVRNNSDEKDKNSILVKEYHDIEYSLETKIKFDTENEFNDFQSALDPNYIIENSTDEKKDESLVFPDVNSSNKIINDFGEKKPFDAEDKIENKSMIINESITLSPSRLVNSIDKSSDSSIGIWMNSFSEGGERGIDAVFPKCSIDAKKKAKINQNIIDEIDDEWSDFMGASQQNVNIGLDSKSYLTPSLDNNDWTDFVSVPAKSSLNSSQLLLKPNFSSWNQPSSHKQYVHQTSFLSKSQNSNQSDFMMSKQPITITDNFNYHNPSTTHQNMPNGISTIIPDLHFAIPKNLLSSQYKNGNISLDSTKK